jgi:hypothetical protein
MLNSGELVGPFKNGGRTWRAKGKPPEGSWRIVTHRDRYPDLIRHLLQVEFPGSQAISVAPPKWNQIEHRLFSFISLNWRGQPLLNYETIINLIGGTKTQTGLKVKAVLDTNDY